MNLPLSEQDTILLNAYLDEETSPAERSALEKRLSADPALRAELEALRGVKMTLDLLPRLRVPRSFTLDAATYALPIKKAWWEFSGFAPALTAVGVMAIALVCGGLTLTLGLGGAPAAPAAAPLLQQADQEQPALMEAATEESFAASSDAAPAPESGVIVQPAMPLPTAGDVGGQPQAGGPGGGNGMGGGDGSTDTGNAPSTSGDTANASGIQEATSTLAVMGTPAALATPAPASTGNEESDRLALETPSDKMAATATLTESTQSEFFAGTSSRTLIIAAGAGIAVIAGLVLGIIFLRRRR